MNRPTTICDTEMVMNIEPEAMFMKNVHIKLKLDTQKKGIGPKLQICIKTFNLLYHICQIATSIMLML